MGTPENLDGDTRYQLGVISGKLDLILVQNAETDRRHTQRLAEVDARLDAHDTRLTSLEADRWKLLGGAGAIGTAFTGIIAWLGLK